MIFSIGILLAFIGWALRPTGLSVLKFSDRYLRIVGTMVVLGLFMVVLSIAIMAWGNLP